MGCVACSAYGPITIPIIIIIRKRYMFECLILIDGDMRSVPYLISYHIRMMHCSPQNKQRNLYLYNSSCNYKANYIVYLGYFWPCQSRCIFCCPILLCQAVFIWNVEPPTGFWPHQNEIKAPDHQSIDQIKIVHRQWKFTSEPIMNWAGSAE